MRLDDRIRNYFQPINVESLRRAAKVSQHTNKLTPAQIDKIIDLIVCEAQTSREFGLFIDKDHLDTEIYFWLTLLHNLGGIDHIRNTIKFDIFIAAVTRLMDDQFFVHTVIYHHDLKKLNRPGLSPNAFRIHLESVRHVIAQTIYNNMF